MSEPVKCCICGRPLTDPDSVKAGIGPICAKNQREKEEREKRICERQANE